MICLKSRIVIRFRKILRQFKILNRSAFTADKMPVIPCDPIKTCIDDFIHPVNNSPVGEFHQNPENAFPRDGRNAFPDTFQDIIYIGMFLVSEDTCVNGETLRRAFVLMHAAEFFKVFMQIVGFHFLLFLLNFIFNQR